jgi:ribosomal protein S18 acetylase RimI-like enzyme
MTETVDVQLLGEARADEVVVVLADAFAGYPIMRYVLGDDDRDRLATLVRMFVMARLLRGEPVLGLYRGPDLAAAALVSFPDGPPSPEAFRTLRADVWRRLGADAEARYEAYGTAMRTFAVDVPHIHLNMVGVRRAFQGQGLARRVIDAVQRISTERPGSRGVTLTTEDPANVPFYERLGFEAIGRARIAPGLDTWGFFRPDPT